MGLDRYRDKRNLTRSGEPSGDTSSGDASCGGKQAGGGKPVYVIHKHDASQLHYDLRLEIDGTLKSWAVPKGPSTDPSEKRLAVETEDHPLDYAGFEGVIPEGEYGAGTVMVWDKGHFSNLKDDASLKEGFKDGHLEIRIEGQKLRGGYALTHMRDENDTRQWLLVKMKDKQADARRNPVSSEPDSAQTGRSLEEIRKEEGDTDDD